MQRSSLNDPVFGELRDVYEGASAPARLWQGNVSVEVFNEPLHVQLETTDTIGITQTYYAAFEEFKNQQQTYKTLALEALLEFYQKDILPLWRENDYFGVPELAPDVQGASEFEKLLSYPRLFIAVRGNGYSLGLEFECTWDVEHGAGVRFEKGTVVAAGLAEVASYHD
jgi:hypothetical protein